jgi:hypothetical protein
MGLPIPETFSSESLSLKKAFKRSYRVFRATQDNVTCEIGVFRDKVNAKPVLTGTNCPSLHTGAESLPNISNSDIGGQSGFKNNPKPEVSTITIR